MKYVFRRNSSVGAMDAESDEKYLEDCFFDTGDYSVLSDTEDPKRIVLGRVGAGKSALLAKLKNSSEHALEIRAETLSLNYIANSDIIQFFEAAGVKLDLFYQLLWRHIFVIELLKMKYRISKDDPWGFLSHFKDLFQRDKSKERALEYLRQWNDNFWQDTETHVKEFAVKLEKKLSGSIEGKVPNVALNVSGAQNLSNEVKGEVVHKAQSVVNENQIRELGEIIDFLADEIFVDRQNRFYLIIDRLDEAWVDDKIRYKLIRALFETIKTFQRVRPVKIVIAIREDLLRKVFDETREAGFQEEKYESLLLRLRWKKSQLAELLDLRINKLVREQYTKKSVSFNDVFKTEVRGESAIDYVLGRTLLRPRDVIAFVNSCLELSEGKEFITPAIVQDAERLYSLGRLRSIGDEWSGHYPKLQIYAEILRGRSSHFKFGEITEEQVEKCMENYWSDLSEDDPLGAFLHKYLNNKCSINAILIHLFRILYTASIVGIKVEAADKASWSYLDDRGVSEGQIKSSSTINVHPMLWRALDIVPPARGAGRHR